MIAPRISRAALARIQGDETVEPAKPKRRPQTSMWDAHQAWRKRVEAAGGTMGGSDCPECCRLYRVLGEALRGLRAHHEAHWSGEWEG